MAKFPAPVAPFIPARNHGGRQTPKALVLHGTVSSDNAGTARNIANWWKGPTSPMSSAHYTVDPGEVIQSVGDHTVAYHCGYNTGSIGIEHCDEQVGPASRWQDADSQAILQRSARLAAELCLAYGIAARRPSIAMLKLRGPHGIYGHNDSRLAFGGTTHTDPRDFPWDQYLRMVKLEVKRIKNEAKADKKRPKSKKRFKVLHAPLHGATATKKELRAALKRPGLVSVAFSEAYQHASFFKRLGGWRTTTGAKVPKDANGRSVRRDVAILVKRWRKPLESGVRKASEASTPLRIAPERWLAFTVDNLHGKPLAHISLHPHAVVREADDWASDRGIKYRGAMNELRLVVEYLRGKYGADLDIVVTGDLQYRQTDPARKNSPKDVFRDLGLSWVATGIDWVAVSESLVIVNTVIVPTQVNGQDHPWIEVTLARRV